MSTVRDFVPVDPGFDSDPTTQIERLFVYFLQNLFRKMPAGFGMRWSPEEKTSEVVITSEKPRIESIEKMPHIVCVSGSSTFSNLGLDQLQKLSMATGERTHTDLVPMTMAYHCQAREGLHARRLAWNTKFYTAVLRRLLMGTNKLHHVSPSIAMSAESAPTAYVGPLAEEEVVSVVVTVPFYWQPAWIIKDPSHVLQKLDVSLRVRDRMLRPPRIKGRPARSVTQAEFNASTPAIVQKALITKPDSED